MELDAEAAEGLLHLVAEVLRFRVGAEQRDGRAGEAGIADAERGVVGAAFQGGQRALAAFLDRLLVVFCADNVDKVFFREVELRRQPLFSRERALEEIRRHLIVAARGRAQGRRRAVRFLQRLDMRHGGCSGRGVFFVHYASPNLIDYAPG